jgi:glycyl-tRNA synthetase beta chain
MPQLLFELGCEELPASCVRKAFNDLRDLVVQGLAGARLAHGPATALGTPRRLIVCVEEVAERQPDAVREQRGPSLKAAFADDGTPTKALEGFLRSQGVHLDQIRQQGDYVYASRTEPGRPAAEVLAEVLPAAVRSLSFEKSMRWGTTRMRFARPIRWILASFGGALVAFDIEGVASGLTSRGHRFARPEPFEARELSALLDGLRERGVEPDPCEREARIRAAADPVARPAHGARRAMNELVEENVFLTEWPSPVEGTFPESYLALPEPVLVMAMAKHERFFPVFGEDGRLRARFLSIRNHGDEETVRAGNEWVLTARFADAKFFYDEDLKHSLGEFLERTAGMSFHEGLGTVRQRAERLERLCRRLAPDGERSQELAALAGRHAKADLSCGLVGELPGLQGQIGGHYARREGLPEEVAEAIARHYEPPGPDAPPLARTLHVADQLDKLAGLLGIGLAPSGSSDPFGLRRSATLLIEAARASASLAGSLLPAFDAALAAYSAQGFTLDAGGARRAIGELFASRYRAILAPEARYDAIDAALLEDDLEALLDPRGVALVRLPAMRAALDDPSFVFAATRPLNIVAAAARKGLAFQDDLDQLDLGDLDSKEGEALAEATRSAFAAMADGDVLSALRPLAGPIGAFFDAALVMTEDARTRTARLTVLAATSKALRRAGDFTRLVVDGP